MAVFAEQWESIRKPAATGWPHPVVADYDEAVRTFSWERARAELEGLPGGRGLNIAHEAVDRHAAGPRSHRRAIRWLGRDGRRMTISYAELRRDTNRFANVLRRLGVGPGDTVALLMGRVPELYVAALGTLKAGAVLTPLFSAFGPEPIQVRMELSGARVLVTSEPLYDQKVVALRHVLPALEHVLVVTDGGPRPPATIDLHGALGAAGTDFEIAPTDPEQPALLHFTSGTTGAPKGAIHVHEAVVAHRATGQMALDLHTTDVFWCTADPGG
jgi:acetyl-CoA synthetase